MCLSLSLESVSLCMEFEVYIYRHGPSGFLAKKYVPLKLTRKKKSPVIYVLSVRERVRESYSIQI